MAMNRSRKVNRKEEESDVEEKESSYESESDSSGYEIGRASYEETVVGSEKLEAAKDEDTDDKSGIYKVECATEPATFASNFGRVTISVTSSSTIPFLPIRRSILAMTDSLILGLTFALRLAIMSLRSL